MWSGITASRFCTVRSKLLTVAAMLVLASMVGQSPAAQAQSGKDFYQGKKVSLFIGYRAGGSYGLYGRLLARHYGKFIPGKPIFVPKNMPGAGSLVLANYLYNVAPKDGSMIGVIGQSVYLMQQLKRPKIKFDARKFNWIGRFTDAKTLVITWHTSKVKTIADAKKFSVPIAVGGTLSGSTLYVSFLNKLVGTKFRPVKGYGSAGAFLAVERGEMDGTSSVSITSLSATHPTWLPEKKVNVVVQVTLTPSPKFPNVPGIMTLVSKKRDRAMMEAIVGPNAIGRPVMAPPGIPAARVAMLRRAFDRAVKSPKFLEEARKMRLSVNPLSGEELQQLIIATPDLSPDMVEEMNKVVQIKYRSIKKKKKTTKKK